MIYCENEYFFLIQLTSYLNQPYAYSRQQDRGNDTLMFVNMLTYCEIYVMIYTVHNIYFLLLLLKNSLSYAFKEVKEMEIVAEIVRIDNITHILYSPQKGTECGIENINKNDIIEFRGELANISCSICKNKIEINFSRLQSMHTN